MLVIILYEIKKTQSHAGFSWVNEILVGFS